MKRKLPRPSVDDQRKFFNEVYLHFCELTVVDWYQKYKSFETLLEDSMRVDFWVVTGISEAALRSMAKSNWSTKGIRRGHALGRQQRASELFGSNAPIDNAFEYYMQHDKVTLVTAGENTKYGVTHWSKVYPLPHNLFGWHTGWGISIEDVQIVFLESLMRVVLKRESNK